MSEACVVFTTFPDAETAGRIVSTLVEEHLAACGSLLPRVESVYVWEDAIQREAECMAILKTTRSALDRLKPRLSELHPYEVPEVIAIEIVDGLPAYLQWLFNHVRTPEKDDYGSSQFSG